MVAVPMLELFAENLFPIFLAAGAGYVLAARLKADPRPLAHAAFLVFAPCLVFRLITDSELPGQAVARMMLFSVVSLLGLAGIAWLVGRLLGWSRTVTIAVSLAVLLPNAGNFGLPASVFAFGDAGLAQATVFFVASSVVTFTFGVFLASLGKASFLQALARLPRVPAIWAVVLGFAVAKSDTAVPFPLERTIDLLSHATIPTMLVVLGMQLQGRGVVGPAGPVALALSLRLVGGAGCGLLLAPLFGLEGPAYQAGILQAAMPPAVICIVLATEYDVEPALVTSIVCVGTLVSPLTLTPVLSSLL